MTEEMQGLYEVLTGQYGPVFETIEMWACINALGIKPYRSVVGKWCFSYSDDGVKVKGFGDTIYEAACNFYNEIRKTEA